MGKTYEEIKIGANTFATAVKVLEAVGEYGKEQQVQGGAGAGLLPQAMIPAITLNAFTCELALKAMVVKKGSTYEGIHTLDKLYDKISEKDKEKISGYVIGEMKKCVPNYGKVDFDADLAKHARLFVDWRYFFEKRVSANLSFIESLFNAVLEAM